MPRPDLDAIREKWLQLCGSCDAGIGGCTHPAEDYRPVMDTLVAYARELEAENERLRHPVWLVDGSGLASGGVVKPGGPLIADGDCVIPVRDAARAELAQRGEVVGLVYGQRPRGGQPFLSSWRLTPRRVRALPRRSQKRMGLGCRHRSTRALGRLRHRHPAMGLLRVVARLRLGVRPQLHALATRSTHRRRGDGHQEGTGGAWRGWRRTGGGWGAGRAQWGGERRGGGAQ